MGIDTPRGRGVHIALSCQAVWPAQSEQHCTRFWPEESAHSLPRNVVKAYRALRWTRAVEMNSFKCVHGLLSGGRSSGRALVDRPAQYLMEVAVGAAPQRREHLVQPGIRGGVHRGYREVDRAHHEDGPRRIPHEFALIAETRSVANMCCFPLARAPGVGMS